MSCQPPISGPTSEGTAAVRFATVRPLRQPNGRTTWGWTCGGV
jgi:hypothetical protein